MDVSVLEDAIILFGDCSSSAVWLEKTKLTGTTNDIISRNIKKDAAVKHPIRRDKSVLTILASNIIRNYLSFIEKTLQWRSSIPHMKPQETQPE